MSLIWSVLIAASLILPTNGRVHSKSEMLRLARVLLDQCGVADGDFADRIIGGEEAHLGEYPWIARLSVVIENCRDSEMFICGGSLITERHVVTAAHCITDIDSVLPCKSQPGRKGKMQLHRILLGEHNIQKRVDCRGTFCAPPAQYFNIVKAVYHANFDHPEKRNDIAVLQMHKAAEFNNFVYPICLPTRLGVPKVGSMAQVAGWGLTDVRKSTFSNTLLRLSIKIVENGKCYNTFKDEGISIGDTQICAGGLKNKDSCGGDSGGPLMMPSGQGNASRQYLIGLVSFGKTMCGTAGAPAVYTSVYKFIPWILRQIMRP